MSKQYGLIVPNKNKPLHPLGSVRPSIFGDDSDSDSGSAKPTGLKRALKRQDRLLQEKAVEEDPTVFQYDELYDDMNAKRKESKLSRKDLDKKPKYISKLLASADRRKRENERRIERQVQKEREAEGEEFKDKESFVTSAYRAKLEELKQLEEQEQREEYLETLGDVRKQGNLDGFYRHLYDQKVLYEDKIDANTEKPEVKSEPGSEDEQTKASNEDKSGDDQKPQPKIHQKKRKYRKRGESSESEPEVAVVESEKNPQHLPSNIDADSDFSIDSSDSDEEDDNKKVKVTQDDPKDLPSNPNEAADQTKVDDSQEKEQPEPDVKVSIKEEPEQEETKEKKPKIDIWKKRTVGEAFDEALKRYFERKASREAGTYVRPTL